MDNDATRGCAAWICPFVIAPMMLATAGCRRPVTEVLLVIDSDLSVPAELDRVVVTATGPSGDVRSAGSPLAGLADFPRTLGIVHRGGPFGDVEVLVEGVQGERVVVARRAVFEFVPYETRILHMNLLRRCQLEQCPASTTCGELGCRALRVSADELEPYHPAIDRIDGAVFDARVAVEDSGGVEDAGWVEDSGRVRIDGGRRADARVRDSGGPQCTDLPATCAVEGSSCTCDRCACVATCGDDCAVTCEASDDCRIEADGGTALDVTCNASVCSVSAVGRDSVTVMCRAGARCTVDCASATTCAVQCDSTSECLVRCHGAGNCGFSRCVTSAPMTCGDPDVRVCNRPCR